MKNKDLTFMAGTHFMDSKREIFFSSNEENEDDDRKISLPLCARISTTPYFGGRVNIEDVIKLRDYLSEHIERANKE